MSQLQVEEETKSSPQVQASVSSSSATSPTSLLTFEDRKELSNTSSSARNVVEQTSCTQAVYDEKTGEAILQRDIPNKIIVARGKKISFYYERARRILRLFDGMIVTGFGTTVCLACSLVEVLCRNEMADIVRIETKLDAPINYVSINEYYNDPGQQKYYENAPPQTAITFHLQPGKYGRFLSGYHQRKLIEVFEKYDTKLTGLVSLDDVRSMKLEKLFHANESQIAAAKQFLNDPNNLHGANGAFILPDFIKYCSHIVHPLIKDNMFKRILFQHFDIGSNTSNASGASGTSGVGNSNGLVTQTYKQLQRDDSEENKHNGDDDNDNDNDNDNNDGGLGQSDECKIGKQSITNDHDE